MLIAWRGVEIVHSIFFVCFLLRITREMGMILKEAGVF